MISTTSRRSGEVAAMSCTAGERHVISAARQVGDTDVAETRHIGGPQVPLHAEPPRTR